jgi:hypothetical protein
LVAILPGFFCLEISALLRARRFITELKYMTPRQE